MTRIRTLGIAAILLFAASAALASWYDDYEAGLDAVRKGQWNAVVQKMTAAINGNPRENDKARTYGAIFINYHPYYYRGVANLNLGKYEQAIADLEKTSGPGPEDLGDIDTLMSRAKSRLASASAPPAPEPQPVAPQPQPRPTAPVPVPVPVQPAAPVIDPALRQQVANEIANARARMTAAQQRKATGAPQFGQGAASLADANTRNATAKTNEELRVALASAQNAVLMFDTAAAPGAPPTAVATTQPASRPAAASTLVLGDTTRRVRSALQLYFNGDFEDAARAFHTLSTEMPNNGWIYAFLGAAQYSVYAFEIDESYRSKAQESFKLAKKYGKFRNGLPEKYFSRRIRRAFDSVQ
jgi:tetratricopeptide (TPR) repeat protein